MRPFANQELDPGANSPAEDAHPQDTPADDDGATPAESFMSETPPESFIGETPPESFVGNTPPESFRVSTPPESFGGETPPEVPARDQARLLVQSPHRLYFYWSFAADPHASLRRALGGLASRYVAAVRLIDETTDAPGEAEAAPGGGHWFDVLPGRAYRAEVGFAGDGLPFVRMLSSDTVETPAVGVSSVSDPTPEFRVGEREFARLLEATGFAPEPRQDAPAPTRDDDATVPTHDDGATINAPSLSTTPSAVSSPSTPGDVMSSPARRDTTSPSSRSGATGAPILNSTSSPATRSATSSPSSWSRPSSPSSSDFPAGARPKEF